MDEIGAERVIQNDGADVLFTEWQQNNLKDIEEMFA